MSYSNKVIDHYENPRNVGTLDKNDDAVGTGLVGAPACGDVMRLQIKVGDDGKIQDAKTMLGFLAWKRYHAGKSRK
jgi:nitrogen fixation NifU-like protein